MRIHTVSEVNAVELVRDNEDILICPASYLRLGSYFMICDVQVINVSSRCFSNISICQSYNILQVVAYFRILTKVYILKILVVNQTVCYLGKAEFITYYKLNTNTNLSTLQKQLLVFSQRFLK